MSLSRRIDQVEQRYPRRHEPTPEEDEFRLGLSRLSLEEQFELDQLLGKMEDAPQLANGQGDPSTLTDTDQVRLNELWERMELPW